MHVGLDGPPRPARRRAAGVRRPETAGARARRRRVRGLEAGRGLGEVGVNTLVLGRLGSDALPCRTSSSSLGAVSLVVALAFGAALGPDAQVAPVRGNAGRRRRRLLVVERLRPRERLHGHPADPLVDRDRRRDHRRDDRLDRRDVDLRRAPGQAPLPALHRRPRSPATSSGACWPGRSRALVGTESLIVIAGVLFVVAAVLIARLPRRTPGERLGAAARRIAGRSSPTSSPGSTSSRRSPLMRLVAVAYVLLRGPGVLRDLPVPARRRGRSSRRRPSLRLALGPPVGGRDRDLVRRVARAGEPHLRAVRGAPAPRSSCRSSTSPASGSGSCQFSFATAARARVRPAVDPAGPLERGVERLLQPGPRRAPGAGPGVPGWRARARSGPPVRRPAAGGRHGSSRPTRCSGSGWRRR